MDSDKINKWMDIAKQFAGGEFWTDIFDQPAPRQPGAKPPHSQGAAHPAADREPRADVLSLDGDLFVLIDLPGIAKEDVELSLAGDLLQIKGVARPLLPGAVPLSSERQTGPFERAIRLPAPVDPANSRITATFQHGVLTVRIPAAAIPRTSIPID